jgi:hypothetical protein
MLEFLDAALLLAHLLLQLLHLVDHANATLVSLSLLLKAGNTVGEAQARILRKGGKRKQHGGCNRTRHAEPGCETVSQLLHAYCAV